STFINCSVANNLAVDSGAIQWDVSITGIRTNGNFSISASTAQTALVSYVNSDTLGNPRLTANAAFKFGGQDLTTITGNILDADGNLRTTADGGWSPGPYEYSAGGGGGGPVYNGRISGRMNVRSGKVIVR